MSQENGTELGRFEKRAGSHIKLTVKTFQNIQYVDIREYVETDSYTGPTKKGIRFELSRLNEFAEMIERARGILSEKESDSESSN
jgi:hypothetical protein